MAGPSDRARRHRADLPDSAAVGRAHRRRQRADRGDVRRRDADKRCGPARGRAVARVHRARREGARPARRAQPASAQVPRARARARVPARARAPGRGAVRPQSGGDRQRRRPRARHPPAGCDDRPGRARDARGARACRSHRRAESRRRHCRRRRGARDARTPRSSPPTWAGPCMLEARGIEVGYGAGARARRHLAVRGGRRARLRRRRERRRQEHARQRDRGPAADPGGDAYASTASIWPRCRRIVSSRRASRWSPRAADSSPA